MPETVFVSMPFGDKPESRENEWTKLFHYGLKPLEGKLPTGHDMVQHIPIKLWRADRNLKSLALKRNVIVGIEQCSFMLCVLTTAVADGTHGLRLCNPNVLWELGYAEALNKPIVVLTDDESLRQLPILAGVPNVCIYNHKLVKEVSQKHASDNLKSIACDLVPYFSQASKDAKRGIGGGAAHRARAMVYPSRDSVDISGIISTAQKQVDILTTNLDYFLTEPFLIKPHPISSALQNGATVRIVAMDPESVIAEYRAKQLVRGQDVPGYRRELREAIIWLYERFGDHPLFHLHIYNDLPLQITSRVDQTIITSIVTRGDRARKRIQIQFKLSDEGVTESFVAHFQSMFDNSIDVTSMKWVFRHTVKGSKNTSNPIALQGSLNTEAQEKKISEKKELSARKPSQLRSARRKGSRKKKI